MSLDLPMSRASLTACGEPEESAMVQRFGDVAPSDAEVTDYDHKHILSIIVCSTAKSGDGIGARPYRHSLASMSTANPRARPVYDSHLARATSLSELPYFASMFQLAPYLWG